MASISTAATGESAQGTAGKYTLPLIILTTLFFMWGFITCMNDILMPYLQNIFQLTAFQTGFIQTAFFGAYFFISLGYFLISTNIGDPLAKIGYQNGVILGLITAGVGCCLFYPAAEIQEFWVFLMALFVLASGITILQIAANPYVSLLGPQNLASSRLNLTQAFNSLGTTIAPIIGSRLIFQSVISTEEVTADAVKAPYLYMAAVLFLLAVLFAFSKLPKFTGEKIEKGLKVFRYSHLTFGVIAIFMYVGGEVAIGSFLIRYFEELMGFNEATAGPLIAFYWGGLMVGRFFASVSLTERSGSQKLLWVALITILAVTAVYFTSTLQNTLIVLCLIIGNAIAFYMGKSMPARTLAIFAAAVIILLITTVFTTGLVAMWSVLAIGLFNSIMFPSIFTLAIRDLGKYTSQASSLLVMAIVGGAVIPPLMGLIEGIFGVYRLAFLLPIICYLFILYYGVKGHEVKSAPASDEGSVVKGVPSLQG